MSEVEEGSLQMQYVIRGYAGEAPKVNSVPDLLALPHGSKPQLRKNNLRALRWRFNGQLLALEFSFRLSEFVIGPFAALFPPAHS